MNEDGSAQSKGGPMSEATDQNSALDADLELQERVSALVDGELNPREAAELEAQLGSESAQMAHARALGDDFRALGPLLRAELELRAEQLPEARFEQIWDAVDRELDREARLRGAAADRRGPVARWLGLVQSWRMPNALGAAAVALLVLLRPGSNSVDTGAGVALSLIHI